MLLYYCLKVQQHSVAQAPTDGSGMTTKSRAEKPDQEEMPNISANHELQGHLCNHINHLGYVHMNTQCSSCRLQETDCVCIVLWS